MRAADGDRPQVRWQVLWVATAGAMLFGTPLRAAEPAPGQAIATAATVLAASVAARHRELESSPAALHALIDERVRPLFDLEGACRLILREHWEHATSAQRRRFVTAFYHFLRASHAAALLDFRDDTVTVLPRQEPAGDSAVRVQTVMKLRDGSRYRVDYYMRPTPAGWKILDVIAEGVSYVRTYRSDFGAEIRAHGLDGLTRRLEADAAAR